MKIYKGYQLIKAIADGEIKEGAVIKDNQGKSWIYDEYGNFSNIHNENQSLRNYYSDKEFALLEFYLGIIENEIDIQSIEELAEDRYIVTDVLKKINELVQAVKQLNKEVKEISKRS